jgi:CRISPR/Cas system-associated endonuclease Cas1
VDDFVIQFYKRLRREDFILKSEDFSTKRKGKREYLNDVQTHSLMKDLDQYFESMVEIPRIRMGERQEIETLINEEALLLAQYLRNEKQSWRPRIANLR